MIRILCCFSSSFIFFCLQAHAEPNSHAPTDYRLVWADEFTRSGLPDPTNWVYDTEANATGWYNGELQYYAVSRPETTRVFDGKLSIIARKERLADVNDYGGQDYSSGRLTTRGRAEWTYGHFELRAKLPCGKGTWPSFFSLGPDTIPWPGGGSVGILSQSGATPTSIYSSVHTPSNIEKGGDGQSTRIENPCADFHTYHATWSQNEISIGIDGEVHFTFKKSGETPEAWPFNKPRYLIVNLAIGGTGGGEVDDSIFPVSFDIDFIRVYQKP